tara:strand:+ start:623 stop:1225 length:603 start_codon:yes stop_codon:yes gene_type:complete
MIDNSGSSRNNDDILRIMGFIGFVSILVGAAVAVFDTKMWLHSDDAYSNAMTYAMGAFTLQGMSFFLYKLLLQDSMDDKASWTRTQRTRDRRLQDMQSQFANAQLEQELKVRQMTLERQLHMMEKNPEAYMQVMGGGNLGILDDQFRPVTPFENGTEEFNPPPTHKQSTDQPITLGVDYGKEEEEEPKKATKGKKTDGDK